MMWRTCLLSLMLCSTLQATELAPVVNQCPDFAQAQRTFDACNYSPLGKLNLYHKKKWRNWIAKACYVNNNVLSPSEEQIEAMMKYIYNKVAPTAVAQHNKRSEAICVLQ
jgi:hypothetical protein